MHERFEHLNRFSLKALDGIITECWKGACPQRVQSFPLIARYTCFDLVEYALDCSLVGVPEELSDFWGMFNDLESQMRLSYMNGDGAYHFHGVPLVCVRMALRNRSAVHSERIHQKATKKKMAELTWSVASLLPSLCQSPSCEL